jgi:hypothetical protein
MRVVQRHEGFTDFTGTGKLIGRFIQALYPHYDPAAERFREFWRTSQPRT